jgi:hypothetical protein
MLVCKYYITSKYVKKLLLNACLMAGLCPYLRAQNRADSCIPGLQRQAFETCQSRFG